MLTKSRFYALLFLSIFAVLLSVPSAPLFAQTADVTDTVDESDAPAATEVIEEAAITLGVEQEAAANAAAKTALQEYAKRLPTISDGGPVDDVKMANRIFLPIARGGDTTANAAATEATNGTILYEGFEGVWPYGTWYTFDNNGSGNGSYCWDDDNFFPYRGYWSAWPARGCANGLDPEFYYYPTNVDSWMVYGPFSLAGAKKGSLEFRYWNNSERNYDFFWWCASRDRINFYCNRTSGYSGGWKNQKLDFKKVPTIGNILGDSSVWVALIFTSDGNIVSDGPFVDEIYIKN